jgi:methylisocitrate lyase
MRNYERIKVHGFSRYQQTGAGTTASRLGMADLGLAQLHDMKTNAEMIANLDPFGPPLIADMDTGYGGKLYSQWETMPCHRC